MDHSSGASLRRSSLFAAGSLLVSLMFGSVASIVPPAFAAGGDACVPGNLVAYWPLDEGAGTAAEDVTANTNDGTLTNGPVWTASAAPTSYTNPFAITFDGTDDFVDTPGNVGGFDLADPFTVAGWINPVLDSTDQVIYGNAWSTPGYLLRVNAANRVRFILITNGSNYLGVDSGVLSAGWHHVAGVWDGTTVRVYIDGVEDSAVSVVGGTVTTITTAVATNIGRSPEAGSEQYYQGDIDDVRVYDAALDADDIGDLYDGCPVPVVNEDFGDAPDPAYPTLLASGGARHVTGGPLFLGSLVDADTDGQPTAAADGDDADGTDDDDGVAFTSVAVAGETADVDVTASVAGLLDAWIDFGGDGTFDEPGDRIFTSAALLAGVNALSYSVPPGAAEGTTFARFRVSVAGGLLPTGAAPDGEVEDYTVVVVPKCNGQIPTIVGTEGDDFIIATNGINVIHALGGNDFVDGKGGDDVICAGEGNDLVNGGNGKDWIDGGAGNDLVNGNNGDDEIDGNEGSDLINGNNGVDTIDGGQGIDTVNGGAGDDVLEGDDEADIVNGDAGKDTISGGDGPDILNGGDGNDTIGGNEGNDILNGGRGNDALDGGPDTDACNQNQGSGVPVNCEV